jgi:hypothetical protein
MSCNEQVAAETKVLHDSTVADVDRQQVNELVENGYRRSRRRRVRLPRPQAFRAP